MNTLARALILLELAYAVAVITATIVLYGLRSPWRASPMGRHLMAFMVTTDAELASLLALGLGAPALALLFLVVFGAIDVVITQRLVLLIRAQHRQEEHQP